jgi:hemoglobin-like flavoprotein
MTLQIDLLEESFALVVPRAQELADTFYERLFADYPDIKPLFRHTNLREQKRMLLASLVLIVNNLRKPDVLTPILEELGMRHVNYGVRDEHYPAVGRTLLKSLETVAGHAWNASLEAAWSEAFEEISRRMLHGAAALKMPCVGA